MAKPKGGLGRGLEALIPSLGTYTEEVEVERLVGNPFQPRTTLNQAALEELAASLREHGILQPLLVSEIPSSTADAPPRYQIIAGERRWRAARLAGLATVPVVVRDASPQEVLELALVENLQRQDLNPLEEAEAYRRLTEEFHLTQEEVAQRVGKSRAAVANSLRLLRLPESVKASLAAGEITEGHARALLGLPSPQAQEKLLRRIRHLGLSVRQVEEAIRRIAGGSRSRRQASRDPEVVALEDELRRALGTKVSLQKGRLGGKLVIYFYSDEELEALYDIMMGREG